MTSNQWEDVLSLAYGVNGNWVPVTSAAFGVGGVWKDATTFGFDPDDPITPPDPPATGQVLGQYRTNPGVTDANGDRPDEAYFKLYGDYPMIAGSYYTTGVVNEAYETARVSRGTVLAADLDSKSNPGMIWEVANWTTVGQAYVDKFLTALARVKAAAVANGSTADIYAAWCHEYVVKRQQTANGTANVYTDARDMDVATYAASASRFYARCAEIAPGVKPIYWTGGMFASALDAQIMALITTPPAAFSADIYVSKSNSFTMPLASWKPMVDFIKSQPAWASWNGGQTEFLMTEFAIDAFHGDTNMAAYYAGVQDAMTTLGIRGAIQFDVNKTDNNGAVVAYKHDDGAHPQATTAFGNEVDDIKGNTNVPVSAPTNVRVLSRGSTSITVGWDASVVPAGARPIIGYIVFVGSVGAVATDDGVTLSATITNLSPSTTYQITVVADNGIRSTPSSPVLNATTTASTQPPNPPANLRQTAVTSSQVTLAWDAAIVPAGAPPVTEYRVYQDGTLAGTTTTLTLTDAGLSGGTTYSYTVTAFNGIESASSAPLTVSIPQQANVAANAPTNLVSTNTGSTTVNLSWTASTLPSGAAAVTEYRVFRGGTQIGTSTSTSYVVTGLSPLTAYSFTVRAYNGLVSAASNTLAVTTQQGGGPGLWQLIWDLPMTTKPAGVVNSGNGIRTTVDKTYNRLSQATWDSNGCTINMEYLPNDPQNATYDLYSADLEYKGQNIPNYFAGEGTMILLDYLGVGSFPAWWFRPGSPGGTGTYAGQGEIDWWEYNGGLPGGAESEWKSTLINTPYAGATEQATDKFATRMGDLLGHSSRPRYTLGDEVRWRIEHTPNVFKFFVNGTQIAEVGQTEWLAQNTTADDPLYAQFEDPSKFWYFRTTYQAGNGTGNKNAGDFVGTPPPRSRLITKDVQFFKYTG